MALGVGLGAGEPARPEGVGLKEGLAAALGVGLGATSGAVFGAGCGLFTISAAGTTIMPISTVTTKTTAPHSRRTKAQFTGRAPR